MAELKMRRGRVTKDQEAWLAALRRAGVSVYVWRPDDFEAIAETLGLPRDWRWTQPPNTPKEEELNRRWKAERDIEATVAAMRRQGIGEPAIARYVKEQTEGRE